MTKLLYMVLVLTTLSLGAAPESAQPKVALSLFVEDFKLNDEGLQFVVEVKNQSGTAITLNTAPLPVLQLDVKENVPRSTADTGHIDLQAVVRRLAELEGEHVTEVNGPIEFEKQQTLEPGQSVFVKHRLSRSHFVGDRFELMLRAHLRGEWTESNRVVIRAS